MARWRDRGAAVAVRDVVASGAAVNAVSLGMTALTEAAGRGDVESTRALLQAGADPNQRGRKGLTPLCCATAVHGRPELMRLLVDSGADVNAADPKGLTPLMWAVRFGNSAAARQLLELGADRNAMNNEGDTALRVAKLRRQRLATNPRLSRLVAESDRLIRFLEEATRP
jgi:ankyrin repeat protein